MRSILKIASCIMAFALLAPAAQADVVSDFWQGVFDAGYGYGDQIRVVFVSSPVVDAKHQAYSYYDNFGDGLASTGIVTSSFGLNADEWKPLVTTYNEQASAPVKTWINQYKIPVFNTKGELIAESADDMLATTVNGPVTLLNSIRYDESGDNQAPDLNNQAGFVGVWTGTNSMGEARSYTSFGNQYDLTVGSLSSNQGQIQGGYTAYGNGNSSDGNWVDYGVLPQSVFVLFGSEGVSRQSIYVMSGAITVPEPATVVMWLGLGCIGGVVFWRKRRQSS